MKIMISILILLVSTNLFAQKKEINELMNNYLKAFHQFDSKLFKEISSEKYYKQIAPTLKTKKLKHKGEFIPYAFDLKFKPALITQNRFFVQIKDKKEKDFGEYYYIVEKQGAKYIIMDYIHKEE